MEHNLELASGAKIKIPANCIAKIEGDMVIIEENKSKFKKGDFIVEETRPEKWIFIFSHKENDYFYIFSCLSGDYFNVNEPNKLSHIKKDKNSIMRLATTEEKQLLINKLHEFGIDWDEEKLEIVDYMWKPKKGDIIWYITSTEEIVKLFVNDTDHKLLATEFRTKELAEAALETLKNLKHY